MLGFNRQTFTYWELEHEIWGMTRTLNPYFDKGFIEYPEEGCTIIPAPTIPEALDWLRERKRIICAVDVDYFDGWYYTGKYLDKSKIDFQYTNSFDDHYNAESALLDAVLTYLENKALRI